MFDTGKYSFFQNKGYLGMYNMRLDRLAKKRLKGASKKLKELDGPKKKKKPKKPAE